MLNINNGLYQFSLNHYPKHIKPVVELMYADAPVNLISDFSLSIRHSSLLRKLVKPNVVFYSDQHAPFKPLPLSQSYPLLEWGMNWCIAAHDYSHFIVHAAVLVKDNQAVLFPAFPGSGKSTLTTYLGLSGWQVYSDEMAIIDRHDLTVKPLFRPACIKNQSISLVKTWFPEVVMTPPCHDTSKGTVAHVKLHGWSTFSQYQPVPICGLVFPKYRAGQALEIFSLSQIQAFQTFCQHSFNYHVLGQAGFELVNRLIPNLKLFEVNYSDLSFIDDFLTQELIA